MGTSTVRGNIGPSILLRNGDLVVAGLDGFDLVGCFSDSGNAGCVAVYPSGTAFFRIANIIIVIIRTATAEPTSSSQAQGRIF